MKLKVPQKSEKMSPHPPPSPTRPSRVVRSPPMVTLFAMLVRFLPRWVVLPALLAALQLVAAEPPRPPSDPAPSTMEAQYRKLLQLDDEAQTEVDRWIREAREFERQGAGSSKAALALRVEQRLKLVREAYEAFLERHPRHVEARVAFASFLGDIGEEEAGIPHLKRALELNPKLAPAWNNLAKTYAHNGPVEEAFACYEKAIELEPAEPIYHHGLAQTIYVFRRAAMNRYRLNEAQAFEKALGLHRKALELAPSNLLLATDLAQSFYGANPPRREEALAAWKHALTLATTDQERQGIHIHLARVQLQSGKLDEAEGSLAHVDHPEMREIKEKLQSEIAAKKAPASTR